MDDVSDKDIIYIMDYLISGSNKIQFIIINIEYKGQLTLNNDIINSVINPIVKDGNEINKTENDYIFIEKEYNTNHVLKIFLIIRNDQRGIKRCCIELSKNTYAFPIK